MLNLADSKTGKKPIILPAAAIEVLATLPRIDGTPFIIASGSNKPRADIKRPWASITEAAGLGGTRLHDLRHSFASIGAGGGLGLPVIGRLLGHASPAMTARYAHLADDPMRRAADQIGNTISAAMNRKPTAEIVPINKRSGSVD